MFVERRVFLLQCELNMVWMYMQHIHTLLLLLILLHLRGRLRRAGCQATDEVVEVERVFRNAFCLEKLHNGNGHEVLCGVVAAGRIRFQLMASSASSFMLLYPFKRHSQEVTAFSLLDFFFLFLISFVFLLHSRCAHVAVCCQEMK